MKAPSVEHLREVWDALAEVAPASGARVSSQLSGAPSWAGWTDHSVRSALRSLEEQGRVCHVRMGRAQMWDVVSGGRP